MEIGRLNTRIASTSLERAFKGGNYQILGRTVMCCDLLSPHGDLLGFGMIEIDRPLEMAKRILEARQLINEWTNELKGSEVLDRGVILNRLGHLRAEKYKNCERDSWATAVRVLDVALWDALGKESGQPLWRIFGGNRNELPVIAVDGYYEPEGMDPLEHIQKVVAKCQNDWKVAGLKIKVGRATVANDLLRVGAARQAGGREFILTVDANRSWTVEQAEEFAKGAGEFGLRWIEEPFALPDDSAVVAQSRLRKFGIPINAGQSEKSVTGCLRLLNKGSIDIQNFIIQWNGGLTPGYEAAMWPMRMV